MNLTTLATASLSLSLPSDAFAGATTDTTTDAAINTTQSVLVFQTDCTADLTCDWERLGWILVQKRWISANHLQTALLRQFHTSQKLGEILLEWALISEDQLRDALREQYWRRNGYWVIG